MFRYDNITSPEFTPPSHSHLSDPVFLPETVQVHVVHQNENKNEEDDTKNTLNIPICVQSEKSNKNVANRSKIGHEQSLTSELRGNFSDTETLR